MKASERYLRVVLSIMLYRVVKLVLVCGAEILRCDHSAVCWEAVLNKNLFTTPAIFARAFRIDGIKAKSRGISWGKQNIKFANARNRSRSTLFILSKRNDDLMVMQNVTVWVSTKFTSLLLAVGTSTVATALKKVKTMTSTHNLPLSSLI